MPAVSLELLNRPPIPALLLPVLEVPSMGLCVNKLPELGVAVIDKLPPSVVGLLANKLLELADPAALKRLPPEVFALLLPEKLLISEKMLAPVAAALTFAGLLA